MGVDPSSLPLPIVVSRSIGALTRGYDASAPAGAPSLPMLAALVRLAPLGSIPVPDLALEARISRRSATAANKAGARHGWVQTVVDPAAPRRKLVRFDPSAVAAADAAASARRGAEARWLAAGGDGDRERATGEALVGAFDLELPHHPISYGTADPSITGGSDAGPPADPRIPPHGTDWKPVLRTDPSTAVGLPITSLLSQVLVQLTIDYDRRGRGTLHFATRVLRHIGGDGVPLAAVAREGVTGDGTSNLERHGVVHVDRDADGERRCSLTAMGRVLRDAYEPLLAEIDADWRARYGNALVDALREELLARRGGWLDPSPDGNTPDDHLTARLLASS